jgi:F-type H+-transporting ATPase subunit a
MEPEQDKKSFFSRIEDWFMRTLRAIGAAFVRWYRRLLAWVRLHPRKAAIWTGSILLFLVGIVFQGVLRPPKPHVALSGEPIFVGGWLTNSTLTTIVVDVIIIALALLATARMKTVPGRWQNFVEMMLEYLYRLSESVAGRDARKYLPWVVTIFLYVVISNWFGLLPGVGSIVVHQPVAGEEHALTYDRQLAMADGDLVFAAAAAEGEDGHGKEVPLFRAPTADLNTTFALALVTMVMVQWWGVRALGVGYFRKFFTFKGPNLGMKLVAAFVGILELVSEFSRLIAFGFRLFGNIFAGEIVLATMAFLIAYWLPVPFYVLEIFVGFVQALVFMMLALVFFTMATISHGHDH